MKLVSAHQPQFFPHLSFFEKISVSDTYVCLDKLKYSRHSYQTRNKIKMIQILVGHGFLFHLKKILIIITLMIILLTLVLIGKKNI